MKFILILISRIRNNIQNNTVIFSLFILGIFTCNLMFIYSYGNFSNKSTFILENPDMFSSYEITFENNIEAKDGRIEEINNLEHEDVILISESEIKVPKNISLTDNDETIQNFLIEARQSNTYDYTPLYGTPVFNKDDNRNAIAIPGFSEDINIYNVKNSENNYIIINNKEYEIIGLHNLLNSTVPYNTFINNNFSVSSIKIDTGRILSRLENNKIVNELYKIFPESKVIDPYEKYSAQIYSNSEDAQYQLILLCILFAICFTSLMFLMKYMIDSTEYENIIYALTGASKDTVVTVLVLETLVYVWFSLALASAFHVLFYKTLFSKVNIYASLQYDFIDYIYILCFISIIALVCTLPFVLRFYRQTVIKSKRNIE